MAQSNLALADQLDGSTRATLVAHHLWSTQGLCRNARLCSVGVGQWNRVGQGQSVSRWHGSFGELHN